jgi:hypothetical protein
MSIDYPGTKLAGKFSQLGEQNKGKGPLDPQEEYLFELVETKDQQMKSWQSAEDKAAGKPAPKKVHAGTTWRVVSPGKPIDGILVFQKFNIETISWGKGPTDSKRSKVIKFMDDIGILCLEGKIPVWDNIFILTMKIRARVIPSNKPDEYFFKDGSFRKYQV